MWAQFVEGTDAGNLPDDRYNGPLEEDPTGNEPDPIAQEKPKPEKPKPKEKPKSESPNPNSKGKYKAWGHDTGWGRLAEMIDAAGDFVKNYSDMREANWKGSDKYFHAKANFQATQEGPGGEFFAEHFSNLREIWDQNVKGYPRSDSESDQKANKHGRDQAASFKPADFKKALKTYRPLTLPSKY